MKPPLLAGAPGSLRLPGSPPGQPNTWSAVLYDTLAALWLRSSAPPTVRHSTVGNPCCLLIHSRRRVFAALKAVKDVQPSSWLDADMCLSRPTMLGTCALNCSLSCSHWTAEPLSGQGSTILRVTLGIGACSNPAILRSDLLGQGAGHATNPELHLSWPLEICVLLP